MNMDKYKQFVIGFLVGFANCYLVYSIVQNKVDVQNIDQFLVIKQDISDIKHDVYDIKHGIK